MKFLETVFGTEALTYEQFAKKVESAGFKLADLSNGDYVDANKFKALETERDGLKTQLTERDTKLSELEKNAGNNTDSQKKGEGITKPEDAIATLQAQNEALKEKYDKELRELKLNNAVEKALISSKAKNLTATKALLADFLETAKVDDKGNVAGLAIKGISEAEETSFLFDKGSKNEPQISGAAPANPDKVHPTGAESYEARLAKARKDNDNLAAIQIKREAAENGVYLN